MRAGRAETRLFDLFGGAHWTLLDFGGSLGDLGIAGLDVHAVVGEAARPGDVVDVQGHAHTGYGVDEPALLLIRPDGYLGWCGDAEDLTGLRSYLLPKLPR
ncbi:hypothetical protein [Saccharopolyspora gloriosae]|uniref:aromatic-ring hydroxylase C-terminal domain-containing protein n=1 Tax=Saccharopolyspora gloriosae TaxID=455344 RepID=UPI0037C7216F